MRYLVFFALPFLLLSCNGTGGQKDEPVQVKVMQVGNSSAQGTMKYTGMVEPESATPLSFELPGTISGIVVKDGDKVSKGQLIATIDDTPFRSAYTSAMASYNQASDASKRLEKLHEKRVLADIKWVEIQTQLSQAQSLVEATRNKLQACRLTAPASGVISKKCVEQGQTVVPGMEVVKLVDVANMVFKVAVPERDIRSISKGMRAKAKVSALSDRVYDVIVTDVSTTANMVNHSYTVSMNVKNADGSLLPGMLCTVTLEHKAEQGDAEIVLPSKVIMLTERNDHYVWVVDATGKVRKKSVEVGETTSSGVIVKSGISMTDRVVTDGYLRISDGCAVKITR